jgi:hypothetical protein
MDAGASEFDGRRVGGFQSHRRHRLDPPDALPDGVVVRSEIVPSEPEGPLLDETGQTFGDKLMK